MDHCRITAGAVIIINPIKAVGWCVRNRVWPALITYLHFAVSLVIVCFTRSNAVHVMQYVGDGKVVHTDAQSGRIRMQTLSSLPPGYMETARFVTPQEFPENVRLAFIRTTDRANYDPFTIPMAGVYRWLYALGLVDKKFLFHYRYTNCATFIAKTWLECGYDFLDGPNSASTKTSTTAVDTCWVGIYPSDFDRFLFFTKKTD